jgi:hypothetical protein
MKQPIIVAEILSIVDPNKLVARVRDVGVACAMARTGDAEPRGLLQHLLDVAEAYVGDKTDSRWQMLVGLIDVLADEVRNSDASADKHLVLRTDSLMRDAFPNHYGGGRDAE